MKDYKNYKNYYIENRCYKNISKIETIKKLLKADLKNEIVYLSFENWKTAEDLTNKQFQLFKNKQFKQLKELLKKQLEKEKIKLQEEKQKANEEYEKIKQLKDIKKAIFEINWTSRSGVYGFQCSCFSRVWYKNGDYVTYESEKTGGCGYDKASSALSYNLNKIGKILLIKNSNKIIKNKNKHYDCYACEDLYFSYGVGLSSYLKMFEYFGFKTEVIYHKNEDITLTIEK